ncbi:ABC transporter ATP-binding protein [soil metagenome]
METSIPTPAIVVGLAVVAGLVALVLIDLWRHDVRHLPKWAWALIVVFVSFPFGAIVYFVVGRVPAGEAMVRVAPRAYAVPIAVADVTGGEVPAIDAIVSTRNLTKVYGDTVALSGVDLVVPRGAIYGLIGPNGAGKTTMLSILAGLRRPTSGTFTLDVDRRSVAVLVDTPLFEGWLTAREVVDLSRHLVAPDVGADAVEDALVEAGLGDARDRRVGGFSRGMLQRLGLAACLVGDPDLLVLDEPSSALDPAGRRQVLDLIGEVGRTRTVMLSTHILSDVQQVCDIVGVIDRGVLRFQGRISALLAQTTASYAIHVRPPAVDLVEGLRRAGWVRDVTEGAPGRITVVVDDAERAEAELATVVASSGAALVSLNPAMDLESAFLELTS